MPDGPMSMVSKEYLRSLEGKINDLNTLLELSSLISSTLEFNDLLGLVIEKARQEMGADGSSILLYNRQTGKLEFQVALCDDQSSADILRQKVTLDIGQGIAGWVAERLQPLIIEDVSKDSRFFGEADKISGFRTKSLMAFPLVGRSGLIGVVEVINPSRHYDIELFKMLCRQFAIAIENALFYRESIERERVKQEVEIAASVQKSLLPEEPSVSKGSITVSAINLPAAKIGGDLYDFVVLPDDKLGALIGDVSGKGISAALFMAKAISDFRHLSHLTTSPAQTLQQLNAVLARAPRGMFMTALYIVADASTGVVEAAVAGHPPCLLLTGDGVQVMEFPAGPPLGIIPMDYAETAITLSKGDRLLLFTDGCFEARDRNSTMLGFEALVRFVKEHRTEPRLIELVVDYVRTFSRDAEMGDDLTILELAFREG